MEKPRIKEGFNEILVLNGNSFTQNKGEIFNKVWIGQDKSEIEQFSIISQFTDDNSSEYIQGTPGGIGYEPRSKKSQKV